MVRVSKKIRVRFIVRIRVIVRVIVRVKVRVRFSIMISVRVMVRFSIRLCVRVGLGILRVKNSEDGGYGRYRSYYNHFHQYWGSTMSEREREKERESVMARNFRPKREFIT